MSGTLVVQLVPSAKLTICSVKEQYDGLAFADLDSETVPEPLAIRCYKMVKSAQRELIYDFRARTSSTTGSLVTSTAAAP